MIDTNENVRYDCFRGCVISGNEEAGVEEIRYRQGCCKLEVYDYLKGIGQEQYNNYFEVRFKNTRKGFYVNASGQTIKTGDLVVVEAQTGWSWRPRRATTSASSRWRGRSWPGR